MRVDPPCTRADSLLVSCDACACSCGCIGNTFGRSLALLASTPRERIRGSRGRGTRAARRCMNCAHDFTKCGVPSNRALLSLSKTCPATLQCTRSLASAGHVRCRHSYSRRLRAWTAQRGIRLGLPARHRRRYRRQFFRHVLHPVGWLSSAVSLERCRFALAHTPRRHPACRKTSCAPIRKAKHRARCCRPAPPAYGCCCPGPA